MLPDNAEVVRLRLKLGIEDTMGSTQMAEYLLLLAEGIQPERAETWSALRLIRLLEDHRVLREKAWGDGTTSLASEAIAWAFSSARSRAPSRSCLPKSIVSAWPSAVWGRGSGGPG